MADMEADSTLKEGDMCHDGERGGSADWNVHLEGDSDRDDVSPGTDPNSEDNRLSIPRREVVKGDQSTHLKDRKRYECTLCEKSFTHPSSLNTHKMIHTGEKPYKCSVCLRSFRKYINLKTHMRLHTGEKPYHCDICQRSFTHSNTLKMHKRTHTGERPYKCTVCEEHFTRNDQLKRHMAKHTGVKPYNCLVCSRSFNQIDSLKVHMEKHTDVKPFECGVCHKSFSSVVALKRHMKNHDERTFQCDLCDNKYVFNTELKRHVAAQHSTERPFKCSICEKSFPFAHSLTKHMVTHTGEKPFKCPYCDKCFTSASNMGAHKRLQHTKTKLISCPECDREFPRLSSLKDHMVCHTGEKTHVCSVCRKAFSRPGGLKVHMRLHTGEKPYTCPVCHEAFQHQQTMQRHTKIHNVTQLTSSNHSNGKNVVDTCKNGGSKQCLKCPFCWKVFSHQKKFQTHMSIHPEAASLIEPESGTLSVSLDVFTVSVSDENLSDDHASDVTQSSQNIDSSLRQGSQGRNIAQLYQSDPRDVSQTSDTEPAPSLIPESASESTLRTGLPIVWTSKGHQEIFRCPVCDLRSENGQFLLIHMKMHTGDHPTDEIQSHHSKLEPFKCLLCLRTFVQRKSLQLHMNTHHNPPKKSISPKQKCPKRKDSLKSQSATPKENPYYQSTANMAKEGRHRGRGDPVRCPVCGKTFMCVSALNKHKTDHSPVHKLACKACGEDFEDSESLKAHAVTYKAVCNRDPADPVDIKPFICQLCCKVFGDIDSLRNHEKTHNMSHPVLASLLQSGPQFSNTESVTVHEAGLQKEVDVKPLQCSECEEVFKTASALISHQALVHTSDLSGNQFPCFKCGDKFSEASALSDAHKTTSFPSDYDESRQGEQSRDVDNKGSVITLYCSTCDRHFYNLEVFKNHLISHCHVNSTSVTMVTQGISEQIKVEVEQDVHF